VRPSQQDRAIHDPLIGGEAQGCLSESFWSGVQVADQLVERLKSSMEHAPLSMAIVVGSVGSVVVPIQINMDVVAIKGVLGVVVVVGLHHFPPTEKPCSDFYTVLPVHGRLFANVGVRLLMKGPGQNSPGLWHHHPCPVGRRHPTGLRQDTVQEGYSFLFSPVPLTAFAFAARRKKKEKEDAPKTSPP
jgi:hypothetical protein